MNADERRGFAEQILSNPLFREITDGMEQNAVDLCVNAKMTDHETRAMAAFQVRAIRAFRAECMAALRINRERKGAPA